MIQYKSDASVKTKNLNFLVKNEIIYSIKAPTYNSALKIISIKEPIRKLGSEESDKKIKENKEFVIEVSNLEVALDNNIILNNLSFNVFKGDFIILLGPSGSGKTTLLKELFGRNISKSDSIKIFGLSVLENFHTKIKSRIGYVEQIDNLHEELTVKQSINFLMRIRGLKIVKEELQKLYEILKINGLENRYIHSLSVGQKKRVSIIQELIHKPEILFLDEPTAPLDPHLDYALFNELRTIADDSKMTVVIVTHKPTNLNKFVKVLFLSSGGHQIYYGDGDNFISHTLKSISNINANSPPDINCIYEHFSNIENGKNYARQ